MLSPRIQCSRRDLTEIVAGVRIRERRIRQAIRIGKEKCGRSGRIVADLDRLQPLARLVSQHRRELLLVAHARFAGRNAHELWIRQRRDLAVPEIEHARDRLPQRERNDDQRGKEMPAPQAGVQTLRGAQRVSLQTTHELPGHISDHLAARTAVLNVHTGDCSMLSMSSDAAVKLPRVSHAPDSNPGLIVA